MTGTDDSTGNGELPGMIVMTFDRATLATAEGLTRVAACIANAKLTPCVVLPAIGDMRAQLIALAQGTSQAERALDALFAQIRELACAVLPDGSVIETALSQLQRDATMLVRAAGKRGPDPHLTDALSNHAERLATLLVTAALQQRGTQALAIDARDVIATNDRHGNARPDRGRLRQLAQQNIGPPIGRGVVVVTEGNAGRSASGVTTSLGEGGEWLSAALLAAALAADELQIWRDATDDDKQPSAAALEPATERNIPVTQCPLP